MTEWLMDEVLLGLRPNGMNGQYSTVSLTQRNATRHMSVAAMTCLDVMPPCNYYLITCRGALDENMHAVSQHASCGIVVIIMIQSDPWLCNCVHLRSKFAASESSGSCRNLSIYLS